MSNILTRTGPDFSKIKTVLHFAKFFSFHIEDALMRARVHASLESNDIAFQALLDTPAVQLCARATDVPNAINQLDRYVATLNKLNQYIQPQLIEGVITSDMPLKTLLVLEEQLIQKYIAKSFSHPELRGIPTKLLPAMMARSENSRGPEWVTLQLLEVFPEDLDDNERLYLHAALNPLRFSTDKNIVKDSLNAIVDYYELAEARARTSASENTPGKALSLHHVKGKLCKPQWAYADRVLADVLLKHKFKQLYLTAPSWEQILEPKTVIEKWLLRAYFATMHEDNRDPRFYPDDWVNEQGLLTYTHWPATTFLEFICHHYGGGYFASEGAKHSPYQSYSRGINSGEL